VLNQLIILVHHFGQPVCIVFTFLLTRPQNDHVYTKAARKKNINTKSLKMRVRTVQPQCHTWADRTTVLPMCDTEVVFIQPCTKVDSEC